MKINSVSLKDFRNISEMTLVANDEVDENN